MEMILFMDYSTKYVLAVMCTERYINDSCQDLHRKDLVEHRIPKKLFSDDGSNLRRKLMMDVCNILNVVQC